LLRDNFGFLHLQGFDDDQWQQVRLKVRKGERKDIPGRIFATDISLEAVRAAGVNAGRAKMGRYIQFRQCPFENTSLPAGKGVVIINPPYGQRLGEEAGLAGLYRGIGDFFKARCEGYRGYVFTANPDLAKKVGLRTSRRIILYNGELESRLLEYEIYEGSRKQQAQEDKPEQRGELLPHGNSRPNVIIKSPEKISSQRSRKSSREEGRDPGRMLPRRITPREETPSGLNAVPDEMPGQVRDQVGAAAPHPAAESAPERRAPVRRRVIPKK
jgi:hypothetical protein